MATNFPTSVDNFTNPTANDSLNLPSHSTQHANANDAIEAIETTLFAGGINYSGLVHINTTSFTTASSVIFNNVFSSSYENYVIKVVHTSTNQGSVCSMRLRASGTDDSSSNYRYWGYNAMTVTGVTSYGNNATSVWLGSVTSTSPVYAQIDLGSPALAINTTGTMRVSRVDASNRMDDYNMTAIHSVNTSYDGFTFFAPGGQTITGTIRVYGLRNS